MVTECTTVGITFAELSGFVLVWLYLLLLLLFCGAVSTDALVVVVVESLGK